MSQDFQNIVLVQWNRLVVLSPRPGGRHPLSNSCYTLCFFRRQFLFSLQCWVPGHSRSWATRTPLGKVVLPQTNCRPQRCLVGQHVSALGHTGFSWDTALYGAGTWHSLSASDTGAMEMSGGDQGTFRRARRRCVVGWASLTSGRRSACRDCVWRHGWSLLLPRRGSPAV